jgi:hypothetical protein
MRRNQRFTALLLAGSLTANIAGCTVDTTTSATGQYAMATNDASELACNNDDELAKIKRKLELRKSTLEDLIASAESDIRTNDAEIATNTGTIEAATEFISHVNDGLNYPPTDPTQESFVGRKHLVDAIEDVGKFPASAFGKMGVFVLVAALEAITLRAAGKAIAKRFCTTSVVRAAEKAALTEAAKKASLKSVGMLKKFWAKFGKAKLVVGGIGAIALPMKARWEIKGDSWETWVPVLGTLKIGGENLDQELFDWKNRDAIKKGLEASLAEMDAEIKRVQAIIKEKTEANKKLMDENLALAEKLKKWKKELPLVEAALAKIGGGSTCACEPGGDLDGDLGGDVGEPTFVVDTPVTRVDSLPAPMPTEDDSYEDYSTWSLEELLAGIDLSDAATTSSEITIFDRFELCDSDGLCTPL